MCTGEVVLSKKAFVLSFLSFLLLLFFLFSFASRDFFKPSAKPLHDLLAGFASVRKQSAVPATPLPPFQGERVGGGGDTEP